MGIILNEVDEAERIINSGEVGKSPGATIYLLSRYYRQKENKTKRETYSAIMNFMNKNCKDFISALWEDYIEDSARKGARKKLREINSIPITQKEIDTIRAVDNSRYEKLLFTMLCYAKFYNAISSSNNSWVNADIKELYTVARVTVRYSNDKFMYLHDLAEKGYISFSKKNDNLNVKVNYICDDGDVVANIDDYRELGYEYMRIIGEGKFINCEICNRLVRVNEGQGRTKKYCADCARKVKNAQNKAYYSKNLGKN